MIRKQVYIEERHDQILKRRARQRAVTEAEIIRQALETLEFGNRQRKTPDPEAGRKALEYMRALSSRSRRGPRGRRWTRESLYDDRVGRWLKS